MKKYELVLSYMLIGGLAGFLASLPFAMTLGYSGLDLEPWIMGGIVIGAGAGVLAALKLGFGLPGSRLLGNPIGRCGLWGSFFGTALGGILAIVLELSLISWFLAIIGFNVGLMIGQKIETSQMIAKQTQQG